MNSNLSHFVRIPHQSCENTIFWRCHRWYNFQIPISTSSMFPTMVDPEDADPSRAWADSQWQPKELSFELANQQVQTNKVPKQKPQLFPTARKRGVFWHKPPALGVPHVLWVCVTELGIIQLWIFSRVPLVEWLNPWQKNTWSCQAFPTLCIYSPHVIRTQILKRNSQHSLQATAMIQMFSTPEDRPSQSVCPSILKALASIKVENVLHSSATTTFFLSKSCPFARCQRGRTHEWELVTSPFYPIFKTHYNWMRFLPLSMVPCPKCHNVALIFCQESRQHWQHPRRSTNVVCCTPGSPGSPREECRPLR